MRNYAYGLLASMILTGGVAIYYSSNPGIGVTADDVAELMEGYNERVFAISTNRTFTNGNWSISVYTNLASLPVHAQMQSIMDGIPTLCANYVQSYTATSVVYWTASNLFIAAGIGPTNGQLKYTVAFATNGVPVYSNKLGQLIITNTLWECYRALANLTITKATPQWTENVNSSYYTNYVWYARGATNSTIPASDPEPWWWNATNGYFMYKVVDGVEQFANMKADSVVYSIYATNPPSYSSESVSFTVITFWPYPYDGPWTILESYRIYDWIYDSWYYFPREEISEQVHADLNSSIGFVSLASMDTGVYASVEVIWTATGHWSKVDFTETNNLSFYEVGTSSVSVAFSGLSAPITNVFCDGIKSRISDYYNWWADNAIGKMYTSPMTDNGDVFMQAKPRPNLDGHLYNMLLGAYVHWTFTRCRP